MKVLKNGKIITEDGILEGYDLVIKNDLIKEIVKSKTYSKDIEVEDLKGLYVTPGFIDIHSDYIENMSSPRPTSVMDFNLSIREAEKVLINSGITTMYHSLSFYGIDLFEHKPIRKKENVVKLMKGIIKANSGKHLIRHRFHARFEIDNIKEVENIKEYIKNGWINLLSFMDHTPGQGQYRNIESYRNILKGYRGDLSDEDIDEMVKKRKSKETVELDTIKIIADLAIEKKIAIASHDDDTKEKLDIVKSFGATISEFPITLEVAKSAKEIGRAHV